jgi:hypothetical protein
MPVQARRAQMTADVRIVRVAFISHVDVLRARRLILHRVAVLRFGAVQASPGPEPEGFLDELGGWQVNGFAKAPTVLPIFEPLVECIGFVIPGYPPQILAGNAHPGARPTTVPQIVQYLFPLKVRRISFDHSRCITWRSSRSAVPV